MEALIPVINELQSVFKSTGFAEINLPQIVVVGSQSCGKSSVLESLVGRSFLPRGSGIVTRCPTILQLMHVKEKGKDGSAEWCELKDEKDGDEVYTDYDQTFVSLLIAYFCIVSVEKQTEKIAGQNKGISTQPIIVKVYSPHVVSLTVVDLPGIVKVAVGDQPEDIETQVHDMIMSYITNPNALILAVSPANADIATSESIKISKGVDPNGDRTLAVVTKLDLMDKGTDATKVLNGEIIDVKLGIVGVVNRSQHDIDNNKSIEDAMKFEKDFLTKAYPTRCGSVGSQFLAKRLNELLQSHIKKSLPGLVERINELTLHYENLRRELGEEIAVDTLKLPWVMTQAVNDFIKDYDSKVQGRQEIHLLSLESAKLAGQEIDTIFNNFVSAIKSDKLANYSHPQLEELIQRTVNVEGFTSIEGVFKKLAKQNITYMERRCTKCADDVQLVLSETVKESLKDKRLQKLNDEIGRVTRKLLYSQLQDTKASINEYITIQTSMIYSTDLTFLNLLKTRDYEDGEITEEVSPTPSQQFLARNVRGLELQTGPPLKKLRVLTGQTGASFPLSNNKGNTKNQCDYLRNLINAYVDVMRGQISDYIPKHIMYNLYNLSMAKVHDEIVKAVSGKETIFLQENEEIVRKRRETNAMLDSLKKAYEIVDGIESGL